MADFKWIDGNQGFYRYDRFQDHTVTKMNSDKIVFKFDTSEDDYDPTKDAFKIKMNITDGVTEKYEEGPNAGEKTLVAGTVTSVEYYNKDGDLILEITDLDISAAAVWAWVLDGEQGEIDEILWSGGGHTFTGSDDGSGPDQDWDGDDIKTGVGDDTVQSKGGNDYVTDRGGSDIYKLGKGDHDTLSYKDWYWNPMGVISGIDVDLEAGTAIGPDGYTDTLSNVERIRGTFLEDTILGNEKDNEFMGFLGNDYFDGRDGFDWVDYRQEIDQGGLDGVAVNLSKGTGRDAFRNVDTLVNIEGAEGTERRDFFTGDNNDNWFAGRGGSDRFIFNGNKFGYDRIDDFSRDDKDKIRIKAAEDFDDLTITYDSDSGHAIVEFKKGTIEVQDWVYHNPGVELVESDFLFG